jgi:hypothetical protein
VSLRSGSDSGQSTVELALMLGLFLLPILFVLVEMGWLFAGDLTVAAATREGARMASNLANGGGVLGCGVGQSPNAANVDPQIIASIERSLSGAGQAATLSQVTEIRLWKSNSSGQETLGAVNVWTYTPNAGPIVDGSALQFSQQTATWLACSRNNVTPNADAIGITVKYNYLPRSPLRYLFSGFLSRSISDSTVMVLNATK